MAHFSQFRQECSNNQLPQPGTKTGGNDPVGTYARISGLDPLASLTVEAV